MSNDYIMMEVFIHGHYETGEPCSIDIFQVSGTMDMSWYWGAIVEYDDIELAQMFFDELKEVNRSSWFLVKMATENANEVPEHYCDYIKVLK